MGHALPASVREILAGRAGEEMELSDRFLNPQLGRIVRTLGYDRGWTRGEGAYLFDENGDRYLDLLSGSGVFAVGRNHPEVIAAYLGGEAPEALQETEAPEDQESLLEVTG